MVGKIFFFCSNYSHKFHKTYSLAILSKLAQRAQTFHKTIYSLAFLSNFAQIVPKISTRLALLSNFAPKFHKTISLRFHPTLLKLCPKILQDYSLAFLSNFDQIVPTNSTRLYIALRFCNCFSQNVPKNFTRL